MPDDTFRALVLDQPPEEGSVSVRDVSPAELPDGNVLVRVEYSDVNYKDGLAVTGKGKVIRSYPMVPGVDLAGTVEESSSERYRPGDRVIATGWFLGERHWGGYSQMARLRDAWLVPLPSGLSTRDAMAIGTAGLTAMLCVVALEEWGVERDGDVVVTGASGGVGSCAVAILAHLGYRVVASTGRNEEHPYLTSLGAHEVIDRSVLATPSSRPLESQRWAGAVDAVGGDTLAGLIRTMRNGAAIAACGNAGGADLHTSVYPFILRGVALLGVESVTVSEERRRLAWERLATHLPRERLDEMARIVPLEEVPAVCREIVAGKVRGRIVVDVNA